MIIPTYHRPDDLARCIFSILQQTRLPEQLLVIDDGELTEVPYADECQQKGIELIYFRKDKPGLTASRNKGIALASGDLIYFLDDDVELFPDYIQSILQLFEQDQQQTIMGVGGLIANEPKLTLTQQIRHFFDSLFLVSGYREGRVLPSGFCVNFGARGWSFKAGQRVDFLAGGVCAYRKQVFQQHLFNEHYQGYGLGEDKDFSYRLVYQSGAKLIVTPDAKLNHYESPQMRYDHYQRGKAFILARHRFFIDHVYRHRWQWLLFGYAVLGYTLGRLLIALAKGKRAEWCRMKGIFDAILLLIRRQTSP